MTMLHLTELHDSVEQACGLTGRSQWDRKATAHAEIFGLLADVVDDPLLAPVLVCLDDLHCASAATLAALRALPRELKRHPVAWLLARSSTPQRGADYLFSLLAKDGVGHDMQLFAQVLSRLAGT